MKLESMNKYNEEWSHTLICEASVLLSEHVAFGPWMANVDWREGWAESLKVLAVG